MIAFCWEIFFVMKVIDSLNARFTDLPIFNVAKFLVLVIIMRIWMIGTLKQEDG